MLVRLRLVLIEACEVTVQSECAQGFSAQCSRTTALSGGEGRPADLSCSRNWRCCFKMKEDFFSLESIMRLMELLSIILNKVLLTDRTGFLLLFKLSEARRLRPHSLLHNHDNYILYRTLNGYIHMTCFVD